MQLGPEQIEHIAKLARLALTEEEKAAFSGQLSAILAYVDALQAVDTEGVEPMAHSVAMHDAFREDVAVPSDGAKRAALVAAFPEKSEDDMLKVKAVFQ